jgi:hypothetical protein
MLRYLPVFILFTLFFIVTNAQTPADSVVKHSSVDSVIIHLPADSGVKHSPIDSVVKHSHPPVESAVKHSPVKSLSDERYNAYLNGEDVDDMESVAALNHYPLPDKALKYKVQIGLNPGQITKLKDLAAALHRKKVEMGDNIIRNEKMLDKLFHSKEATDGTIIFYTNRYGIYMGEFRNAILQACYSTEKILSDDQIKKLEALIRVN